MAILQQPAALPNLVEFALRISSSLFDTWLFEAFGLMSIHKLAD
jgi:hypothetical protein